MFDQLALRMNGEGLGVSDFGERTTELAGRYSSSVRRRLDALEPVKKGGLRHTAGCSIAGAWRYSIMVKTMTS